MKAAQSSVDGVVPAAVVDHVAPQALDLGLELDLLLGQAELLGVLVQRQEELGGRGLVDFARS